MNINTNSHYFVPLRPLHTYGFISLVCGSDEERLIECKLEPYRFDGFRYKLYAVPVDENHRSCFEKRCFYTCDFETLVEMGSIVEKTKPTMHVETIQWIEETFGGGLPLVHEKEIIVE